MCWWWQPNKYPLTTTSFLIKSSTITKTLATSGYCKLKCVPKYRELIKKYNLDELDALPRNWLGESDWQTHASCLFLSNSRESMHNICMHWWSAIFCAFFACIMLYHFAIGFILVGCRLGNLLTLTFTHAMKLWCLWCILSGPRNHKRSSRRHEIYHNSDKQ